MTNTRMYLTAAEAKAANLPSNEDQIARWNKAQAEIRATLKSESGVAVPESLPINPSAQSNNAPTPSLSPSDSTEAAFQPVDGAESVAVCSSATECGVAR